MQRILWSWRETQSICNYLYFNYLLLSIIGKMHELGNNWQFNFHLNRNNQSE